MAKKKSNRYPPRRKRMKAASRIASARDTRWVVQYQGKDLVRGYSKWFGVDFLSAIKELRQLGAFVDPAREAQLKTTLKERARTRKRRKELRKQQEISRFSSDSDTTFACIAGYTPAGFPYGITWEEMDETQPPAQEASSERGNSHGNDSEDEEDIPF